MIILPKFEGLGLWYLTSLSTIFELYCCGQFFLVEETEVRGENHCKPLINYQIKLYRVHLTMSRIQTHNISGDNALIAQVVLNPKPYNHDQGSPSILWKIESINIGLNFFT